MCEIALKQQVIMRSIYCNGIICKITRAYLNSLPAFFKIEEEDLVSEFEQKIPSKLVIDSIENMEKICSDICTEAFFRFQEIKFAGRVAKIRKRIN